MKTEIVYVKCFTSWISFSFIRKRKLSRGSVSLPGFPVQPKLPLLLIASKSPRLPAAVIVSDEVLDELCVENASYENEACFVVRVYSSSISILYQPEYEAP